MLPYSRTERLDQSGVLATALAFGRPSVVTDVGGFSEVAAAGRGAAGGARRPRGAAARRCRSWSPIPASAERLAAAALAAARGPYSWDAAARATLALYERLTRS